jgi:hypothetical protein
MRVDVGTGSFSEVSRDRKQPLSDYYAPTLEF